MNASPEPFSNVALSVLEDTGGVSLSVLAAFHPLITLTIVTVLVVIGVLVVRKFARRIRGLFRRSRASLERPEP